MTKHSQRHATNNEPSRLIESQMIYRDKSSKSTQIATILLIPFAYHSKTFPWGSDGANTIKWYCFLYKIPRKMQNQQPPIYVSWLRQFVLHRYICDKTSSLVLAGHLFVCDGLILVLAGNLLALAGPLLVPVPRVPSPCAHPCWLFHDPYHVWDNIGTSITSAKLHKMWAKLW